MERVFIMKIENIKNLNLGTQAQKAEFEIVSETTNRTVSVVKANSISEALATFAKNRNVNPISIRLDFFAQPH